MNTSLDNIFTLQAGLMRALGVDLDGDAQRPGISEMSVEAATGLVCEAAEVLEAISKMHRAWKPNDNVDAQVEHAKEEAVDALFYLTEMFISLGITSGKQLMELVHHKRAIVLARVVKAHLKMPSGDERDIDFAYGPAGQAMAELKLYVPTITAHIGDFLADPVGYTQKNFDLASYVKAKEHGGWSLPF